MAKTVYRRFFRASGGKRETASFSSKADADRWLRERQRERELGRAGLADVIEPITLHEFAAKWLLKRKANGKPEGSWQQDEIRLRLYILSEFGQRLLHEIRTAEWSDFLDQVKLDYLLSPATRNRIRSLGSKLYNDAIKAGHCIRNPVKDTDVLDESQEDWCYIETEKDVGKYLAEARKEGPAFWIFAMISVNTGARQGEVLALLESDFDMNLGQMRITKIYDPAAKGIVSRTKGKRNRFIGIGSTLRQAVLEYVANRPSHLRRKPLVCDEHGEPLLPRSIRRMHDHVCKRAGLSSKLTPHDLRHTYASHFVMNGGNLATLQGILGHSSYATTLRYAHLAPGHLAAQANVVTFNDPSDSGKNVVHLGTFKK